MAIAPEKPKFGKKMAERVQNAFPILSDVGNVVSGQFGLVYTLPANLKSLYEKFGIDLPRFNGDESGALPLPATFVIDTDGTVVYAFAHPDYTRRAEPDDLVKVLEGLAAEEDEAEAAGSTTTEE